MKKKRLIPIILALICLVAAGVLFGIDRFSGSIGNFPDLQLDVLNGEHADTVVRFSVVGYETMVIPSGGYIVTAVDADDPEVGDFAIVTVDPSIAEAVDAVYQKYFHAQVDTPINLSGKVTIPPRSVMQDAKQAIRAYFETYRDVLQVDDDMVEEILDDIPQYGVQVTGLHTGTHSGLLLIIAVMLVFLGVLLLLHGFLGLKRMLLSLLILVLVLVLTAGLLLGNRMRSMATLKQVDKGFYTMRYYGNYHMDDYLNAGITSVEEQVRWIADRLFFGLGEDIADPTNFACCSFAATDTDGEHLFGRNFDYDETDVLAMYTHPKKGYASIGFTDLTFFGVGEKQEVQSDSLLGKCIMLAAPYIPMDGINETGMGVSILELDIEEMHQDKGKPDMLIFVAIRGILDNCANVDEALDFLSRYDIHTDLDRSFHLFLTDATGRAVVVEWLDNEMQVINDAITTNFIQTAGDRYHEGETDTRYERGKAMLEEAGYKLDAKDAMGVLNEVSWERNGFGTEWSCIYRLEDFSVDVCLDRAFYRTHHLTVEDFG